MTDSTDSAGTDPRQAVRDLRESLDARRREQDDLARNLEERRVALGRAEDVVADAEQGALAIQREAERQAAVVAAEAQRRAEDVVAAARADAARIKEAAEDGAGDVIAAAHVDADAIRADAEAELAEARARLEQERAEWFADRTHLVDRIDSLGYKLQMQLAQASAGFADLFAAVDGLRDPAGPSAPSGGSGRKRGQR